MSATEKLDKKCKATGIETGDYIYVKSAGYGSNNQHTGIITDIKLSYNDNLRIKYNILKNDMTESRFPLKEIYNCENEDFYTLKHEIVEKEKKNGLLTTKNQLIILFNKKGVKNPLLKNKRKKRI